MISDSFIYGGETLSVDISNDSLLVYHPVKVQETFESLKLTNPEEPFPFWAKIWPASKAVCQFIDAYKEIFNGKNILEVAAGLAIPSLMIAKTGNPKKVIATDYLHYVLPYITKNAGLNNVSVETEIYNWESLPSYKDIDILILSDVNYSPEAFPYVMALIKHFITQQTKIVLSTPQRITAVQFIEQLSEYIQLQEIYRADGIDISVFVLHKSA